MKKKSSENQIDIALIIPLQEEFEQFHTLVHKEIGSPPEALHDGSSYYYRFDYVSKDPQRKYACIAVMIGKMGPVKSARIAERIVSKWCPLTVVMVGIAAGLASELRIGDVVVADQVDGYLEAVKAKDSHNSPEFSLKHAGEVYRPTFDYVDHTNNYRFANEASHRVWQEKNRDVLQELLSESIRLRLVDEGIIGELPNIITGHLASGSVVSSSKAFLHWLNERDRKYVALEMEAYGLLEAIHESGENIKTFVVRGVSDFGDDRKANLDQIESGALRVYSTTTATNLVLEFLSLGLFPLRQRTPVSYCASAVKWELDYGPEKIPFADIGKIRSTSVTYDLLYKISWSVGEEEIEDTFLPLSSNEAGHSSIISAATDDLTKTQSLEKKAEIAESNACRAIREPGNYRTKFLALKVALKELLQQGLVNRVIEILDEAKKSYVINGSIEGEICVLCFKGAVLFRNDIDSDALLCFNRTLALQREIQNKRGVGQALGWLGIFYGANGPLEIARHYETNALQIKQEIGHRLGAANTLTNLGLHWQGCGEIDTACQIHWQALEIDRQIRNSHGEARDLWCIGVCQSEVTRAVDFFNEALTIAEEVGAVFLIASLNFNMGVASIKLQRLPEAFAYFRSALKYYKLLHDYLEIERIEKKILPYLSDAM